MYCVMHYMCHNLLILVSTSTESTEGDFDRSQESDVTVHLVLNAYQYYVYNEANLDMRLHTAQFRAAQEDKA